MLLKSSSIAKSINNFAALFINRLNLNLSIKNGMYLQKIPKILAAFYAKYNLKHMFKFYLIKCKIKNFTKAI
jgi:hypothetical protein